MSTSLALAASLPAGFTFNPLGTISTLQQVGLAVVALALVVITAIALFGPARKGNIKKSFDISTASIIALFPLFIVVGVGVTLFASGFFGWFG